MNTAAVATAIREIEAAGAEMRKCVASLDRRELIRAAQVAHEKYIGAEFTTGASYGEAGAYDLREKWHRHDMRDGSGVFDEAMQQVIAADLYPLMLVNPAAFGVALAKRIQEYADAQARRLAY